jgi:4'-phosphopantetheinyl transferase
MPIFKKIKFSETTTIYIWKISESLDQLFSEITLNENSQIRLQSMKSEMHQLGFLSVRKLLQEAGYSDFDLYYDESGKPHLIQNCHTEPVEVSISHSHTFSTIIISNKPVGIDLEIIKEKVLRIAPKFMNLEVLDGLTENEKMLKATVIWGVKETVFKIKNQVGISFPDHIFEDNFDLKDKKTNAQLHFNNKIEHYEIFFEQVEEYALVWGFRK